MALYVEESYIPASLVQLCCDSFCAIRILHVFRKNKRASTCLLRRYEHGFQYHYSCTWCPETSGNMSITGRL